MPDPTPLDDAARIIPTEAEQIAAARLVHLIAVMVALPRTVEFAPEKLGQAAVHFIRALPNALDLEEPS